MWDFKEPNVVFRGKKRRVVVLVVEACELGENKGEGDCHGIADRTQFSALLCKQIKWGTSIK